MTLRLVLPTQSAKSITLGTVADSSTSVMWGGSMMITCVVGGGACVLAVCKEHGSRQRYQCDVGRSSMMATLTSVVALQTHLHHRLSLCAFVNTRAPTSSHTTPRSASLT